MNKSVFLLWHSYERFGDDEDKLIGVYSTQYSAEMARSRALIQPGFCDYPDNFIISKYEVDSDNWKEGFVTIINESDDDKARKSETRVGCDAMPSKYFKQLLYSPAGYSTYEVFDGGASRGFEVWRVRDRFLIGTARTIEEARLLTGSTDKLQNRTGM